MTSSIKTTMLFAALIALFMVIGNLVGGKAGMALAFGFAAITSLASYWYSDKMVLKMYKAQELQKSDAPQIHQMVEELCQNAGIPKPKIYIIPEQSPNAFATGRNPDNAAVAVTQGIMRLLSPEELRGVLAHEIAHIAHRDILIQTIAAIFGAAITSIANMLYFSSLFGSSSNNEEGGGNGGFLGSILIMILAPLAASLIQMAISRSREYLADEGGAKYSSDPLALARALDKISNYSKQIPMQANPATENMFIISPLAGGNYKALFSTHPPTEERIQRLAEMAQVRR